MEHLPPRSPDEEPHGPEDERLWPGEIDLTGATRQDDALADVIGDAIAEAEAEGGEVPDWGARTLARALANERNDPMSGALHRFAITGQTDPEAIARELADLYEHTEDNEIREWINWLGTYVIRLPDKPAPTEDARGARPATGTSRDRSPEATDRPLPEPFAGKYGPDEVVDTRDARSLATVLSMFLDPESELARFADTGDANPVLVFQECETVRRFTEHVPGADAWITRFEQHLASRSDLGRRPQPPDSSASAEHHEHVGSDDLAAEGLEALVFGNELDVVRAYLNMIFARADAQNESISEDSARYLAKLLATILGPGSAMSRFAESGERDLPGLSHECRQLAGQQWPTADITDWALRLEQHLTVGNQERPAEPTTEADDSHEHPQVAAGLEAYGDAFRAYLQLPDADPNRADLLQTFQECFVGTFGSMEALLDELTEIRDWQRALDEAARTGGFEEFVTLDHTKIEAVARATWDIVEIKGKLYVFTK